MIYVPPPPQIYQLSVVDFFLLALLLLPRSFSFGPLWYAYPVMFLETAYKNTA